MEAKLNRNLEHIWHGVPFKFESEDGKLLKALYLYSQDSEKEVPKQVSVIGSLEEINAVAGKEGFDFTFLVSEEEKDRDYFKCRGFNDAFYNIKEHYVHGHEFLHHGESDNPDEGEVTRLERSGQIEEDVIQVCEFLAYYESKKKLGSNVFTLVGSSKDWEKIINDIIKAGELVFVLKIDGKPEGVAIGRMVEDGVIHKTIELRKIVTSKEERADELLKGIERLHSEYNITIVRDVAEMMAKPVAVQLWSPFRAQNNGKGAEYEDIAEAEIPYDPYMSAYPSGMIYIPDIDSFMAKIGIQHDHALEGFPKEKLVSLLLRRPSFSGGEDTLKRLLDIPELSFSMSLLL